MLLRLYPRNLAASLRLMGISSLCGDGPGCGGTLAVDRTLVGAADRWVDRVRVVKVVVLVADFDCTAGLLAL
jgi:hypothetical protein